MGLHTPSLAIGEDFEDGKGICTEHKKPSSLKFSVFE